MEVFRFCKFIFTLKVKIRNNHTFSDTFVLVHLVVLLYIIVLPMSVKKGVLDIHWEN